MVDNKNITEKNNNPETRLPVGEQEIILENKEVEISEKGEASRDENAVLDGLRREIELMQVDDNLKKQAEQKANKISFLADDDKLKNLMQIAREKGIVFAVKVAKSMNDPFILDTLHDAMAKEGYYKDFIK
jgi:hypothetical protein